MLYFWNGQYGVIYFTNKISNEISNAIKKRKEDLYQTNKHNKINFICIPTN